MRSGTKGRTSVIVSDTSALLSLEMGRVLKRSFETFDYLIPVEVGSEIVDISRFDDPLANAAKNIMDHVKAGYIRECKVKDEGYVKDIVDGFHTIDKGEAESLVLAEENGVEVLITDDLRSLSALRDLSKSVRIHLSVYVISRMVIGKRITKDEAYRSIERIASVRNWENAVIFEKAIDYIKDL